MPMNRKRAGKRRIRRQWKGALCVFLLCMVLFVCADCDQQSGGGVQRQNSPPASEVQRQLDEYDRQMAASQRQLAETERQLAESDRNLQEIAAQSKRFDEQLDRWHAQADRVDKIFERWEKLTEAVERRVQEKP